MNPNKLTNKQYRFLKLLYSGSVSRSELERKFPGYAHDPDLLDGAFQNYFYRSGDNFYISVSGKTLFENRQREDFRFRIPCIISAIALGVSIFSIVAQILKLF